MSCKLWIGGNVEMSNTLCGARQLEMEMTNSSCVFVRHFACMLMALHARGCVYAHVIKSMTENTHHF